jgi:hypothetical protein
MKRAAGRLEQVIEGPTGGGAAYAVGDVAHEIVKNSGSGEYFASIENEVTGRV